jgi:hypothetical protein
MERRKSGFQISAEISQENNYRIALPIKGHIDDIQGQNAHQYTGRSIIGEHKSIESTFPFQILAQMYDIAGHSGYIEKIDPDNESVVLACACGARFIASLRDFNTTPPRISPDKIRPAR